MSRFNLSEWALEHRSLVWYFMIVFAIAGVFSYLGLGREEDPNFTIKTMIIQAQWPGASAAEVAKQVTDRIEKKLEELESLDYTKSVTTAGQTIVFVNLLPTTKAKDVPYAWLTVRNMIGDIQGTFPSGVQGPFFNDRFGDVYGNIFAFTGDGLTDRQLRDFVEFARSKALTVPNIGQVEILGARDEAIYLDFSTRKTAALGLDPQAILTSLRAQNAITPSGTVEAGPERISVRVDGQFTSEASLSAINLRVNDRFFPLTDVAVIRRGLVDPPASLFRFNGKPGIALAIGMKSGSNLLDFGKALEKKMREIVADLPVGVNVEKVSDQPAVVEKAVSGFTEALFEAIAIVLAISFVSLGFRAGLVVAVAIPLVLAITFLVMSVWGISLQRISLGALIIALGLLVDDAMIAVEMMVARLEVGDTLRQAATHVYVSTAFPMLTGTLVTVAGFIPIGLNSSAAGEFTFTLFVVIAVSLLTSWIVAVLFTPLLGVTLLPNALKHHGERKSLLARAFHYALLGATRWKWITIALTLIAFGASIYGMKFVEQQFFPSSDRPELIVDWNLPQNASIHETDAEMAQFEKEMLQGDPDVDHWSTYVGAGAPRFVLSFDVQVGDASYGQTVILTKGLAVRDKLRTKLQTYLTRTFPGTDAYVKLLDIGPPVGRPVQYRVSGPDLQQVRTLAQKVAAVDGDQRKPRRAGVRLDGARAGAEGRGVAGQGAPTRRVVAGHLQFAEQRRHRRDGHAGARRHLSHQRDRPRRRRRARLDRDAAQSATDRHRRRGGAARGGGEVRLHAGTAENLAPFALADHHRAGGDARAGAAGHRRHGTGPQDRHAASATADRLRHRRRRRCRGERQGAGADRRRGPDHAFHHGDDPDDPVAEFSAPVSGVRRGAAGADRRGGGAVAEPRPARLRRHSRRARPDRHSHPQFGHPHHPDRRPAAGGARSLGRRDRSDRAPHAADPAHRGRGDPRADPHKPRNFLGADGLRDDGRHRRRHRADAAVPAGALYRVVPGEAASSRLTPPGSALVTG